MNAKASAELKAARLKAISKLTLATYASFMARHDMDVWCSRSDGEINKIRDDMDEKQFASVVSRYRLGVLRSQHGDVKLIEMPDSEMYNNFKKIKYAKKPEAEPVAEQPPGIRSRATEVAE